MIRPDGFARGRVFGGAMADYPLLPRSSSGGTRCSSPIFTRLDWLSGWFVPPPRRWRDTTPTGNMNARTTDVGEPTQGVPWIPGKDIGVGCRCKSETGIPLRVERQLLSCLRYTPGRVSKPVEHREHLCPVFRRRLRWWGVGMDDLCSEPVAGRCRGAEVGVRSADPARSGSSACRTPPGPGPLGTTSGSGRWLPSRPRTQWSLPRHVLPYLLYANL